MVSIGFEVTLLPLLYIGTALVYMLAAVPIGRLADRVGRTRVYLGGYVVLLALYVVLLAPGAGAHPGRGVPAPARHLLRRHRGCADGAGRARTSRPRCAAPTCP